MRPLNFAAALAGLLTISGGCGEKAPAPAPRAPVTAPAAAVKPKPAAPAQASEMVPAQPVPAEALPFVYDSTGLRDPFEPFIKLEPVKKKQKPLAFVPKTPLQRYAVEELRLVGVVWADGGKARALIQDPEGKGYVVGTGTLVGDRGGQIVGIQPDQVVIEERFVDLLGEENVNKVMMTLHKPEGEVKP